MSAPWPADTPTRGGAFVYAGYDVEERSGVLTCRYELRLPSGAGPSGNAAGGADLGPRDRSGGAGRARAGVIGFTERVFLGPGRTWSQEALEAARLVYLLAGVSYYKAGAPGILDLAKTRTGPGELELLRTFYLEGLAELAYRNDLDLSGLEVVGGVSDGEGSPRDPAETLAPGRALGARARGDDVIGAPRREPRALVPFGGGMDSIVTAEIVADQLEDVALFVLSRRGDRFLAIEEAASATGLEVVRAERELDEKILRSSELGYLNGHVPVTGIVSAIAVLVAALEGRELVVMSNERSASSPSVVAAGRAINHQWSKGLVFEEAFAGAISRATGGRISYFSYLRAASELWVARQLAERARYLGVFHSCNRAFHVDPARRLDHWCGRCEKCCFVDLVLSPFVPAATLRGVFRGAEPLEEEGLSEEIATLIGVGDAPRPFECVGDLEECRAALVLAAERPDRRGTAMLHRLLDRLGPEADVARRTARALLTPSGPHHVPDALEPPAALS